MATAVGYTPEKGGPHVRRELATPRVKKLDRLGARVDLVDYVCRYRVCQVRQQGIQHVGCLVGHAFNGFEQASAAALYDVGCQGPWAAHKAKHRRLPQHRRSANPAGSKTARQANSFNRHLSMDLLPQNGQRLADKLQLVQLQRVQLAHLPNYPRLSKPLHAQAAARCLSSHLIHAPHGVLYQGAFRVIYVERHAQRRKGRKNVTAQMR